MFATATSSVWAKEEGRQKKYFFRTSSDYIYPKPCVDGVVLHHVASPSSRRVVSSLGFLLSSLQLTSNPVKGRALTLSESSLSKGTVVAIDHPLSAVLNDREIPLRCDSCFLPFDKSSACFEFSCLLLFLNLFTGSCVAQSAM